MIDRSCVIVNIHDYEPSVKSVLNSGQQIFSQRKTVSINCLYSKVVAQRETKFPNSVDFQYKKKEDDNIKHLMHPTKQTI